ncbi:hypothetical protein [Kitasatospora sp. SUK 42]|uniref:hypothetical protein n=1 Tax=Kitasatospora sp. SUK 42 TaxID=1588882 RepID=UPI001C314D0C|nr:hypothetical protein [Kitasatospora sp. SUK 42]MBV2155610.1 hypothetical protein [Kitasatospora sp. SUK 42]
MRPGSLTFLVGVAFAVLLALAFATVALGVITVLRTPGTGRHRDAEDRNRDQTRRTPA